MTAYHAFRSSLAVRSSAARRLLAPTLLVFAVAVSSACDLDLGPGPIPLFEAPTTPARNDPEYANRNADGDWNVHLSNGLNCLVFARHASTAQRALEVCRARVG